MDEQNIRHIQNLVNIPEEPIASIDYKIRRTFQ